MISHYYFAPLVQAVHLIQLIQPVQLHPKTNFKNTTKIFANIDIDITHSTLSNSGLFSTWLHCRTGTGMKQTEVDCKVTDGA